MPALSCGTSYTITVDAFDWAGNRSTKATLSASTSNCSATAPANTSPPTISGTAQVGQLLSASTGSWSGTTPLTYTYQWQDCDSAGAACTTINAATNNTYTPTNNDQGHTLRARVTATNNTGSATATSTQTPPVQAALRRRRTSRHGLRPWLVTCTPGESAVERCQPTHSFQPRNRGWAWFGRRQPRRRQRAPGFKMFTLIPASRRSSRSAGQATTTGGSPATTPTAPSSSRTWSGSPTSNKFDGVISTLRTGRCQRSGRPPR